MKLISVIFLMTTFPFLLVGHEGHHHDVSVFNLDTLIREIGTYHLVMLHFPIALIVMTVVAEILYSWKNNVLFDNAARFMIISAAVVAVPTFLLGLAYASGQEYAGSAANDLWWHRLLGIFTGVLAAGTAFLREKYSAHRKSSDQKRYYFCLLILFFSVCVTSYFGGRMAFSQIL